MRKSILVLALVFFLFGFLFSPTVFAQGKSFVVGVENIPYYPHYKAEGKTYTGYARALFDAFAQSKGYTFKYTPLPLKRLFDSLVTGKIDFKYPDNPYWSKDLKEGKGVVYSESAATYIDGVLVLPGNKGKGKAAIKKLGLVMGFTPWEYLGDVKGGSIRIVENPTFLGLMKQGTSKRVDGVYCNIDVAKHYLKHGFGNENALVFDSDLPHTQSSYYLSTTKHPEIIKEFNAFLMEQQDRILELKREYDIRDY